MKNYKFVLCGVLAGAAAFGVQAANIKEQAAAPASPIAMKDASQVTGGIGAPYQFVDPDLAPPAPVLVSGPGFMPAAAMTGNMERAPAQSFAGGAVAAAHTSPGKSGLASTQAAASKISEPATELLLLVALSALAIAVRRQSKT